MSNTISVSGSGNSISVSQIGVQGPEGIQGVQGDTGDTGLTGATGPSGALEQFFSLYVSKAGSDSNSGLSAGDPKLTMGAAVTTATGLSPTEANQVTINMTDSAEYQGAIVLPEWVHIFGPNAGIDGLLEVSNNCVVDVRRLRNTLTSTQCVKKTDSGGLSKVSTTLMIVAANQEGVRCFGGQIGLTIGTMTLDNAEGLVAQNASRILFNIQYVLMTNNSDLLKTNLAGVTSNAFYGEILRVEDDNTSRFLVANAVGDTIDVQAGSVDVLELYTLGTDTVLNLFASILSGTRVDGTNSQSNIMDLAGDSNLQGSLNVEGDLHVDGTITAAKVGGINQIGTPSDLGTPVSGYYELSAGYYVFNESIDWGTNGLKLMDSNETYTFISPLIRAQTYTGTDPFITTAGTGIILKYSDIILITPNATALAMTDGNSLIMDLGVFFGCKQVMALTNMEFLTVSALAMVGCETGVMSTDVEVATLTRLQWSSGADVSGVAYTALGANSKRLIFLGNETESTATESIFDIQASFGGIMSNTGGAHSFGAYFKTGTRDQTDVFIESYHCIGTDDSRFIGSASVQDNTTATTISSTDVFVPFNLNSLAIAGENIERWSMTDSNTGELTCNVDGFAGTLSATLSTTGSGGSSEYHFRVVRNGVQVNGVIAHELSGDMGNTFLSVPIQADAGDTFVLEVANHDNTSNITLRYGDINIS